MKNKGLVVAAVTLALGTVAANGSTGSASNVSADQPTLKVVGPVEAYDAKRGVARVLGQTVVVARAGELAVGDSVSVIGTTGADGTVVASTVKDEGLYVAGSSQIYLSGKVQKVNAGVGTAVVNGITVDLTPLLADGEISPAVGANLQIGGTQPSPGGVVLATATGAKANSVTGVGANSVTGVGKNSVTGVGANSVTGVGKNSVTGVGANSVTGVGKNSVTGVGANSVTGVGKNSVTGVGANSVTGVGKNSVTGVGANSVTGVGKNSVTGVGANSVTGVGKSSVTGVGANSVTGVGKNSVTGVGKSSVTGVGAG